MAPVPDVIDRTPPELPVESEEESPAANTTFAPLDALEVPGLIETDPAFLFSLFPEAIKTEPLS